MLPESFGGNITVKKTDVVCVLMGLFILTLLVVSHPTQPAKAIEPTSTPATMPIASPERGPDSEPCHLELGTNCDFIDPTDEGVSISRLRPRTNPIVGARGVPTYTLVSVTFDTDMDARTINQDTFYLHQEATRLGGAIDYIPVSKIAVFHPDPPLKPDTTYTATVTTGVQDLAGQPLAEAMVWTFTTSAGPLILGADSTPLEPSASVGGMQIYFGDLHSHSGYSDGPGTPADAFATARANGLDFFALTDHAFMLTSAEWQDTLNQANVATQPGQFVALPGFEYTNLKGHLNVFGSDTYVHRNDPQYDDLAEFYAWLVAQPTAIGQFNHPLQDATHDWNFNGFAYNPMADHKIVLRELSNSPQFFLSLNRGWHLGTLLNSDTHQANWGGQRYMGLLAPNLTKEAILEALSARRTFFVSADGQNFAVLLQANGYWMGSAVPQTSMINFTITVSDPNTNGTPLRLRLYDNGVLAASATVPGTTLYTWTPGLPGTWGHYYYAAAYHDGWLYPAYSSPIWMEQPPLADAGVSQTVAPGAIVTLNGRNSWDPDGDALAYQWLQNSGPAVSLNQDDAAQVTFTAPETLGEAEFLLTVIDPGGLTAVDTTVVTITDKPILSITKSGPTTVEPGGLITYLLAVTNSGITTATEVVITDAVPTGATYLSGGTLMPGNIVSWTVPDLVANGGLGQVTFTVTASQGIANADYRVSSAEGASAVGSVTVFTNWSEIYLPVITKVD